MTHSTTPATGMSRVGGAGAAAHGGVSIGARLGCAAVVVVTFLARPQPAGGGDILVPANHASIQEAIDQARDGDCVLVDPGDHVGPIDFRGKRITVRATGGPTKTRLFVPEQGTGSVVRFSSNEDANAVLEGFFITGGQGTFIVNGTYGGGILCSGASPTIRANVIQWNRALLGGGIACIGAASPRIDGNVIESNSGGGIYCEGEAKPYIHANRIRRNTTGSGGAGIRLQSVFGVQIERNTIEINATSGSGGGIYCAASYAIIEQNAIRGNTAGGPGGGIYCTDATPTIRANTFESNEATGMGGAIACVDRSSLSIEHNRIEGNRVYTEESAPILRGGCGIAVLGGSHVWIEGNRVLDNHPARDSYVVSGGGVLVTGASLVSLVDNEIARNAAARDGGGACIDTARVETVGNRFIANTAGHGGGFAIRDGEMQARRDVVRNNIAGKDGGGGSAVGSTLTSTNSAFSGNTALGGIGGALALDRCFADIEHATIVDNEGTLGGGIATLAAAGTQSVLRSIIWDNRASRIDQAAPGENLHDPSDMLDVRHSLVDRGWPGKGNIHAEPLLVDVQSGDVHLRLESPCVDALLPGSGPTHDIHGDARPIDGTLDGMARCDIGADELRPEVAARFGTVGAARSRLESPLRINGSAGDGARVVRVETNQPVHVDLLAPSAGPSPAGFALYAWLDRPDTTTMRLLPRGLGWTSFATPFAGIDPANPPIAIWNTLGRKNRFGHPDHAAQPAPTTVIEARRGTGVPLRVTLQGFLLDRASAAEAPLSVTNAIVLEAATAR